MAFPSGKFNFPRAKLAILQGVLCKGRKSAILVLAHRTCALTASRCARSTIPVEAKLSLAEIRGMEALTLELDTTQSSLNRKEGLRGSFLEAPDAMTVFEFDDFRKYLNHVRIHYPGMRRPITLERWAKKLNYRSPRSIAMVLKGQRLPSEELIIAFSVDLNHSEAERRYFELLVRKEKYQGNLPKAIADELHKLNPQLVRRKTLEAEVFTYVSAWHNYVVLQLFSTPGFQCDSDWISKRLGGKLTKEDVDASLNLLERLNLIKRDENGKMCRSADNLFTMEDIPSAAVRRHHSEQMEQARDALQRQPMNEREFTCLTLRVSRSKIAEVKKAIREFRDKFDRDFFDEDSKDICQLNLQFFFHTSEDKK